MREILFRGKAFDNEWVEGLLVWIDHNDETALIRTIGKDGVGYFDFLVDFETVEQYTGLTDKNGKKIFEGDIVEFPDHGNGGTKIGQVKYSDEDTLYEIIYEETICISLGESFHGRELEVIGNITNNPELLEVGE